MKFVLQSSDAPENYGFTRWVDSAPIDSVQEFIEYLQIKIFDLESKVNHYKEVSEVTKTTKLMIPAMQPVHRMNHALFLTATALFIRRRALRLRHHRLHHLQWVDTAEKAQRSLPRGCTATRTTLVLVTCCIIVFILFFFKLSKA